MAGNDRDRMPLVGLFGAITAICGPDWVDKVEQMREGYTVKCPNGDEIKVPPFRIPEPTEEEKA